MKNKVFGIGLNRTGTTTLGKCLETLGYKVKDNEFYLLKSVRENNLAPIWETIKRYDAFEDFPWPFIYKEVYKRYPDAKYILTTHKDEDTWIRSQIRHAIYGKPKTLWNAVRHNLLAYGYPYPVNHEEEFKEIYRKHNEEVRNFFKDKDSFIELCWMKGDGWEELCEFLGESMPDITFPHAYKSDWTYFDRLYRIAKRNPDKYFPSYNGEDSYEG